MAIEYHLNSHSGKEERRHFAQPVELNLQGYTAIVPINLMYSNT